MNARRAGRPGYGAHATQILFATVMALLGACGGSSASAPAAANPRPVVPTGPNDITVRNNLFAPAALTVAPGTSVVWTWDSCTAGDGYGGGQTCVSHSVAFDDAGASSATQAQGSFSRQFAVAGTYTYHCAVHGAAMSGKVIVQ